MERRSSTLSLGVGPAGEARVMRWIMQGWRQKARGPRSSAWRVTEGEKARGHGRSVGKRLGEPSWRRWCRVSSSLILHSKPQKTSVELPSGIRLGPTSQSLLEHSSGLLETLQSHQGLAQAEEAPGPARPQGKGHLSISQGPRRLTQPLVAERAISK